MAIPVRFVVVIANIDGKTIGGSGAFTAPPVAVSGTAERTTDFPTVNESRAGDTRVPDKSEFSNEIIYARGTGDDRYYQANAQTGCSFWHDGTKLFFFYCSGDDLDTALGGDPARNRKVMVAHSTDAGATWTREVTPAIEFIATAQSWAGANSDDWEEGAWSAAIMQAPDDTWLAFVGELGNSPSVGDVNGRIGLWTSADGINWTRNSTIFDHDEAGLLGSGDEIWPMAVWLSDDNFYHLFYRSSNGNLYHTVSGSGSYTSWPTTTEELALTGGSINSVSVQHLDATTIMVTVKSPDTTDVSVYVVADNDPIPLGTANKTWDYTGDAAGKIGLAYWDKYNNQWHLAGFDGSSTTTVDYEFHEVLG